MANLKQGIEALKKESNGPMPYSQAKKLFAEKGYGGGKPLSRDAYRQIQKLGGHSKKKIHELTRK